MNASFVVAPNHASLVRSQPARLACTRPVRRRVRLLRASIASAPSFVVRHGADTDLSLPTLVFLPGLDGKPLPGFQTRELSNAYNVLSVVPCSGQAGDGAGWDALARAVLDVVEADTFVLVGASFGAALALRVAARAPKRVEQLVLLNSGTALRTAPAARVVAALLPILYAPQLYRVAARILTPFLIDRSNLHESVTFSDNGMAVFDIRDAPLDDVRHRIHLLGQFTADFGNDCVRNLVTAPTVVVASTSDRLLPSIQEARRLKSLLPNVVKHVEIPDVAHAALLDKRVSLRELLDVPDTINGVPNGIAQYNEAFRAGAAFFDPWRRLHSPWIGGLEHLRDALAMAERGESGPPRPVLFVGNHGKYGLQDLPLLYIILAEELERHSKITGNLQRRVRGLAHAAHFEQFDAASGGRWASFVRALGAVPASARAFYSLLREGECVLLFPGGAREVCRKQGEEYKLVWGEGTEFVRPAARFNTVIVPFCTVGADDDGATLLDGQELQRVPVLGNFVRRALDANGFDRDELMPVSAPPKLDRYYFQFLEPVDTTSVNARSVEDCRAVYADVRERVRDGVQDLLKRRESDPKRSIFARVADDTIRRFDF